MKVARNERMSLFQRNNGDRQNRIINCRKLPEHSSAQLLNTWSHIQVDRNEHQVLMAALQLPFKRLVSQACSTARYTLPSSQWSQMGPRRCFAVHSPRAAKKALKLQERPGPSAFTDEFIPGSQRIAAGEEYSKAEGKMKASVEYFRREVATLDMRASGRVTPTILSPVRVQVPDHTDGKGLKLEEIATVGVKEGTTLLVTVFEDHVSFAGLPAVVVQMKLKLNDVSRC